MLDDDFATTGPEGAPELLTQEGPTRVERDSLGEMRIPADVYWGIHTARALVNFPISRRTRVDHRTLDTPEPGEFVRPKVRKKARAQGGSEDQR